MTNWCSAGGERPDMKRNDNWPSENKVFVFGLGFIWLQKVKSQSHSSLNALRWNVQDGPTSAWNMERRAACLTFRNDFNFTMTNASSGQQTTPRRNSHSEVMWISGTQGVSPPGSVSPRHWMETMKESEVGNWWNANVRRERIRKLKACFFSVKLFELHQPVGKVLYRFKKVEIIFLVIMNPNKRGWWNIQWKKELDGEIILNKHNSRCSLGFRAACVSSFHMCTSISSQS